MTYYFKPKPELIRAVGLALGAFMLEAFADPRLATDPRSWAAATGIGVLHVIVVAILGLYSTPAGQQAQPPAQPASAPVGVVQPPQQGVWLNGTWLPGDTVTGAVNPAPGNFGTLDVRVGQSRPAPTATQPSPPVLSEEQRLHQQRSASAQKGWATRRAEREAAPPAPVAPPATKRAKRTPPNASD